MFAGALASALVVAVGATGFAGCGGDETTAVEDSLEDAGYLVERVEQVSAFEPAAEASLSVEGNGIPGGAIIAIEFYADPENAALVRQQYRRIDGEVAVRGSVVYSALPPVRSEQLDAVVAAADAG